MKIKELSEEEYEQIASTIDNEDFWYALTDGGYLNPEDILEDEVDIERVREAISIVKEFEELCPQF